MTKTEQVVQRMILEMGAGKMIHIEDFARAVLKEAYSEMQDLGLIDQSYGITDSGKKVLDAMSKL